MIYSYHAPYPTIIFLITPLTLLFSLLHLFGNHRLLLPACMLFFFVPFLFFDFLSFSLFLPLFFSLALPQTPITLSNIIMLFSVYHHFISFYFTPFHPIPLHPIPSHPTSCFHRVTSPPIPYLPRHGKRADRIRKNPQP